MSLDLIQFSDLKNPAISQVLSENVLAVSGHKESPSKNSKFHPCSLILRNDNSALQNARKTSDFIAVRGSSPEVCAWAANSKGVDLLLQPFNSEKCFLDLQTANVLRDNNIYVAVQFNEFLEAEGFRLSMLMKNASMCVRLCENAGTKLLFVSGAKNEFELRHPKDLASFAVMLGMKKESALRAVRTGSEEFLGRLK